MENINTEEYWDGRFNAGSPNSWRKNEGEKQTEMFAREIAKRLEMPPDYTGTILEFGCALGDAIPVYKKKTIWAIYAGRVICW